jgi:3-isopropylmalate dehydrogenase
MVRDHFTIAVFPGDGIGVEVIGAGIAVLDAAVREAGGIRLEYQYLEAGAGTYLRTGESLPEASVVAAGRADAILLGAMGLPEVRYKDGTEISPQLELRERFELYAGVRPVRAFIGLPTRLADPRAAQIDFVLVREQTEGLFAERERPQIRETEVRDALVITHARSARVFDFAFQLARGRKARGKPGHVTCVDKANVLASMAFFRKVFDERAAAFPDIATERAYVDATALNLVTRPWSFDVLVTENMFGDILSDLAAGLIGSLGLAPSGDIGDRHALFQPAHGSAPDIAGRGRANPLAAILSCAMMLEWLATRHGSTACARAASLIDAAVVRALAEQRVTPCELGGTSGTAEITRAVVELINSRNAGSLT